MNTRFESFKAAHAALLARPNTLNEAWYNGVVTRYANPVLTAEHVPLDWRYDLDSVRNPFGQERLGINAILNPGALEFNGKIIVFARVEGVDRKSFFAITESDSGIDNFTFWDEPVVIPELPDGGVETNHYDMRLVRHEDGWIYGIFCVERKDPSAKPGDESSAVASAGIVRTKDLLHFERLPDLKSRSPQQRNVTLHPEFVKGKYLLYTRPLNSFMATGSGPGIGWALCDDMTHPEVGEEQVLDPRIYHTIKEGKNGLGPSPIKTDKGWLHLAHGVRDTAAGMRYVLYSFLCDLDDPTKVIHRPGGYLLAPRGAERVGDVSNVTFANGWVRRADGSIFLYYGSSDTRIHVATTSVDRMLDYVINTPEDALRTAACVQQRIEFIRRNRHTPTEILMKSTSVTVRRESVVIPTYEPQPPDKNPMFLERRVYQGSSGRVYPLPCIERFAETTSDHAWNAIVVENDLVEVMILPELGGRIHALRDKTNGYEAVYRNPVIKPALIGLAGAWASGGIEFNWPQHHRPSTFLPTDVHIEEHPDGSKTVWMSEHDPLCRMKGMHGVCLHPDRSVVEVKVRAYNRTPFVQTFLWWANVATRVHEEYQSFFPPDVTHVADHAKGTTSTYPLCTGTYYGVNYAARARDGVPRHERPPQYVPPHCQDQPSATGAHSLDYVPNDLTWYANIPVPTSYMCLGSKGDFFGGYDHFRQAGLVHVANHHISPGKKQWTWGNHAFGYAWDRNLTDPEPSGEYPPYIELMAGVYTDNQPDFAFLQPGETKTWSQFWYPIQGLGPVQAANIEAALHLDVAARKAHVGAVTTRAETLAVRLTCRGKILLEQTLELAPDRPFATTVELAPKTNPTDLRLALVAADGHEVLAYQPKPLISNEPQPATEPPPPAAVPTNEELFLNGLHLSQYRHPTRMPEPYFEEALRRDPSDSRCNNALGIIRLVNGDFARAEAHFRTAIARLTHRNPNPYDGEAYYNLGLTLRYRADDAQAARDPAAGDLLDDAYAALYKATWNQAWQAAGYHAIAEIDCRRQDWSAALDHLDRALGRDTDNLKARDLRALVLRRLGRGDEANDVLRATCSLDPLDWWARHLRGEELRCDSKTRLDLAHDYARAGFYVEALAILASVQPEPFAGTGPMLGYTRAWLHHLVGDAKAASSALKAARQAPRDYCFPARVEDVVILEWAIAQDPGDARARYYLGNLFYDRKRHREAIALWEASAKLEPDFPIVWRNLGIGYFNVLEQPAKAKRAYERAYTLAPGDARLLFERDLLWIRLCVPATKRLAALEKHLPLVRLRDDLSVEYASLLNQVGRYGDALDYLLSRRFQPWEGGEGLARTQYERARLALGRQALAAGRASEALASFEAALVSPPNLGETKHLLANRSDIDYWLGCAAWALGDRARAQQAWTSAAAFRGDFQERAVRTYSEMTYFSAIALRKLGRKGEALQLFRNLKAYAKDLFKQEAKVYYFATSLPARLLFDNLQRRQETTALLIEAQAELGLGHKAAAKAMLKTVLDRDPNRALARDLLAEGY